MDVAAEDAKFEPSAALKLDAAVDLMRMTSISAGSPEFLQVWTSLTTDTFQGMLWYVGCAGMVKSCL